MFYIKFIWSLGSICFLLIMFLLNYISNLYTDVDFFHYDLVKLQKTDKKKLEKLTFIIKNNYSLFMIICCLEVIFNSLFTDFIGRFYNFNFWLIILIALSVALITEILPRVLLKYTKKKILLNRILLSIAYVISYFGSWIIKPESKIITNSEKDIIRYINNLTMDNIIEKKEAQLVQAALNFDDLEMSKILIPYEKIIFLNLDMSYNDVKKIHLKFCFHYYPVINNEKEICGIFSFKKFYNKYLDNNKNVKWKQEIETNLIYFFSNQKLDELFDILKYDLLNIVIILNNHDQCIGIITRQDVFDALIGKLKVNVPLKLLPKISLF